MSTLPSIPSKPPASQGNLGAILAWCFNKFMQKTDGQLPAEIISYNRATNRARVRPLISMIATSGQRVSRAPIASVPVVALGGGGFFVNFPLQKGDLGWIEASDRDISLYLQTLAESPPNSKRIHSFEDARFVPDVMSQYTFTPTDGAMVISSLDGTTRVEMSPGKISLFAADVEINSTTFNINNSGAMSVNTGTYNQATTSSSGSTTTGNVNLPNSTSIAGRQFLTHEHSGVQTGTGNSGGVV
jgi:hypothetical protein